MTKEEEQVVVNRMVREFSDCKQRIAVLEDQLRTTASRMEMVSKRISRPDHVVNDNKLNAELTELLTPDQIRDTVDELRVTIARKLELRRSLKDCGITLD